MVAVPLFNPKLYAPYYTRHNAGLIVYNALLTRFSKPPPKYVNLLPMNVNGISVQRYVNKNNFELKDLLLMHDDFERGFGKISLKFGGSANGHNGVKSVIKSLKSHQFWRLRIGLGKPEGNPADWVLSELNQDEIVQLESLADVILQDGNISRYIKDYI